jgi:cytoskeleton protein RodZ
VPERGVPAGALVLLGALLAIGAYVGWYRMSGDGRLPAEPVKPVPARLAPLIEPVKPPAPAATAPTEAPAAAASPVPAVSPSSAAAAVPAPGAVPGSATSAISAISPDGSRITLRARTDAWIQVRDRQGPVLLNRVMRSGETWPVPAKGQLLLTTGNAGGTELLVDGVLAPSLGSDGAVRRDLPLDPDQIRDGKPAATKPLVSGKLQ